jgi:hypothetical protein
VWQSYYRPNAQGGSLAFFVELLVHFEKVIHLYSYWVIDNMFPWLTSSESAEFIQKHLSWILIVFPLLPAIIAAWTKKRPSLSTTISMSLIIALLGFWSHTSGNIVKNYHDANFEKIQKMATPNELEYKTHYAESAEGETLLTVKYKTTKNEQIAKASFNAFVGDGCRIIDFRPCKKQGVYIGFGKKEKTISQDGLSAKLFYKPLAPEPAVDLLLSGACRVYIKAEPGTSKIRIDVE